MSRVFEGSTIAGIPLKNRIIRSATHEGMGDEDGRPRQDLADLYLKLAQGGVGAIITGYMGIQKNGRALMSMRMIHKDAFIDDYKDMNARLSDLDVPVIAQLAHAGGKTGTFIIGEQPVAPSKGKYPLFSIIARELNDSEIGEITDNFAAAVERAKKAGFSGVQLHAAHGYLLHEFLSPHLNRRNDRWGGSTEKRFRILSEIIRKSREKVGNYPVMAKISAYDGDKNGIGLDEGVKVAELLQGSGYDAIEVSCGGNADSFNSVRSPNPPIGASLELVPWMRERSRLHKALFRIVAPILIKRRSPLLNYNVEAAARIKKHVDVPVIVVGGIRRISDMESIIDENKADYVSMCRPFIIEPNIVNKLMSGSQSESRCINCGYCLPGVSGAKLKCYYGKVKT